MGVFHHLILLRAVLSAATTPTECRWGDGVPAEQPTAQTRLTCTPASSAGPGKVEATLEPREASTYSDAKLFTYAPKAMSKSRGLVSVAALAYGSDGGCGPLKPANASERDAFILSNLRHAGERRVDLAVLPENAFGRPGMPGGCFHEAEAVDGPLVSRVAALAAQYSMNIVLPIHEARGERFFNTAVVLNRRGRMVGTYSKMYPVFGNSSIPPRHGEIEPPDAVWPSSEGVATFDLDIGRVAVRSART
jgi:hypothetical protein